MELSNEFTVNVPVDEAWKVLTDVERIAPCMPGAQLQEVEGDEYRGVVKVKVGPITAQYRGTARFEELDEIGRRAVLRAEGRDTRGQGNASATVTATLVPSGDARTAVTVVTDLTVTGKVAQFGRGVLGDVSAKLIGQFVECLESDVLAGTPSPATGRTGAGSSEEPPTPEISAVPADAPGPGPLPASEPTGTVKAAPDEADVAPDGPVTAGPVSAPTASERAAGTVASAARRIESREVAPVDLVGTAGRPVAKRVGPVFGVLVVVLWLLRRRRRR